MPIFEPPTVEDTPYVNPETPPLARRLFRHYGAIPRGRSVLGTWLDLEGSFERGVDGWRLDYGLGTLTHGTGVAASGIGYAVLTDDGSSLVGMSKTQANLLPATAGTQYTMTASARATTTPRALTVGFSYYNAAFTLISQQGSPLVDAVGTWTTATHTGTAPANTAWVSPNVRLGATAAGEIHHVDRVLMATGPTVTWPAVDRTYVTVDTPDQLTLQTATEVYLGGHIYVVSDAVAAALTAAGYAVADLYVGTEGGDVLVAETGNPLEV